MIWRSVLSALFLAGLSAVSHGQETIQPPVSPPDSATLTALPGQLRALQAQKDSLQARFDSITAAMARTRTSNDTLKARLTQTISDLQYQRADAVTRAADLVKEFASGISASTNNAQFLSAGLTVGVSASPFINTDFRHNYEYWSKRLGVQGLITGAALAFANNAKFNTNQRIATVAVVAPMADWLGTLWGNGKQQGALKQFTDSAASRLMFLDVLTFNRDVYDAASRLNASAEAYAMTATLTDSMMRFFERYPRIASHSSHPDSIKTKLSDPVFPVYVDSARRWLDRAQSQLTQFNVLLDQAAAEVTLLKKHPLLTAQYSQRYTDAAKQLDAMEQGLNRATQGWAKHRALFVNITPSDIERLNSFREAGSLITSLNAVLAALPAK